MNCFERKDEYGSEERIIPTRGRYERKLRRNRKSRQCFANQRRPYCSPCLYEENDLRTTHQREKIWTPVILSGEEGARDAKDLGVRYTNGVSLVLVTKNPSVGEYTFCRGVYSFNQYDTDKKIFVICALADLVDA